MSTFEDSEMAAMQYAAAYIEDLVLRAEREDVERLREAFRRGWEQCLKALVHLNLLNLSVDQLGLGRRTLSPLRKAGIGTVGEVIEMQLRYGLVKSVHGFGDRGFRELHEALQARGLELPPPPPDE